MQISENNSFMMSAFIIGWLQHLHVPINPDEVFNNNNSDLFKSIIMPILQGKEHELFNRRIAELFGEIETQVKTFPTENGWIILDKHTKRLLHKDIKNENEVDSLCRKHGYVR